MSSDSTPSPRRRDPNRPLPARVVPAIDPAAPLDPGMQLSPEELAAQRANPPPPPSRRFVLGTAGFAAVAAVGGAGYSFWRTRNPAHRAAPQSLVDALHGERSLIAYLDRATRAEPHRSVEYAQLRGDHAAHAAALSAVLKAYSDLPDPTPPRGGHDTPAAIDFAGVQANERAAAQRAAAWAAELTGRDAALLASIAACEAAHAAVLR